MSAGGGSHDAVAPRGLRNGRRLFTQRRRRRGRVRGARGLLLLLRGFALERERDGERRRADEIAALVSPLDRAKRRGAVRHRHRDVGGERRALDVSRPYAHDDTWRVGARELVSPELRGDRPTELVARRATLDLCRRLDARRLGAADAAREQHNGDRCERMSILRRPAHDGCI